MTLNLDKLAGDYIPYREPTPEELIEIEQAIYVVRELGRPVVRGYSNSLRHAYGLALWLSERTMLDKGTQIDVRGIDNKRIELRSSEDRCSTVVQWVDIEPETAELSINEASAIPDN